MANTEPFVSSLTSEEIEARLVAVPDKLDKENVKVESSMLKVKIGDKTYVLNGVQELIKPNAPTMTASATYDLTIGSTKQITINNAYSAQGGKVHYTTDGSTPSASSASFSGASGNVSLGVSADAESGTTTVKAIVILNGVSSDVTSTTYTTRRKVAAPVFAYSGDKYDASRVVSATCGTDGAAIQLSIDGGSYAAYASQTVSSNAAAGKYKAKATKSGWVDSAEVSSAAVTVSAPKTYYGFSTSASVDASSISTLLGQLAAIKADGIAQNTQYNVTASAAGYVWICQPTTLNPAKIFNDKDAPINAGYNAAVVVGSYNCYRITSQIAAGSLGIYLKN